MTTKIKTRRLILTPHEASGIPGGTVTQIRRVVDPQPPSIEAVKELAGIGYDWIEPNGTFDYWRVAGPVWAVKELMGLEKSPKLKCPFGYPGQRLWCAETHQFKWPEDCFDPEINGLFEDWAEAVYRADGYDISDLCDADTGEDLHWLPSSQMPRSACRTVVEVLSVRFETLQSITPKDAIAAGVPTEPYEGTLNGEPATIYPTDPVYMFGASWNLIHKVGSPTDWNANPFVWVADVKPCEKE